MPGLLAAAKGQVAPALDRLWGIETQTQVAAADLGYDPSGDNLHYEASWWLSVPGVLTGLRPRLGPGDVVLDLGCGKGRALVQLARRPVSAVIGVEADPRLAAIARENLARCRVPLRAARREVVVGDAREYVVPDDVTVVYLGNPFRGAVFDAAIAAVLASADRRPRPMRILYVEPAEHDRLLATGRIRELPRPTARWMRPAGVSPDTLRRYEVLPRPR